MTTADRTAPRFAADREAVAAALADVAEYASGILEPRVAVAVRYALLGAGKRLRPVLVMAAYRACGGTANIAPLAATLEVVHAYSLVHDDLPCMDDDDVRRGLPTVHRVHGVAAATAAGVAMVPLAAHAAVAASRALGLAAPVTGEIVRLLMQAAGGGGMIGGQLLDLLAEGRSLDITALERVHRLKTGALISAAAQIGGLAAGASPATMAALQRYGDAVGLAFQIADDVLDVTATTSQLGKTAGKDASHGKSTYPAVLGLDGARARAVALADDACRALGGAGIRSGDLEYLARYAVARQM
ncbi:MAG TPA: polyprenyl synthetase family protein [Gemmatimonadaceae bacterium]|nr:polyprenyl synthetase family protein [Gemmatimonadaceae bacterium]